MPGPSMPAPPEDWTIRSTFHGYGPSLPSSFVRALTAASIQAADGVPGRVMTRIVVSPTTRLLVR